MTGPKSPPGIAEEILSPATGTLVGPRNFFEEVAEKELEEGIFPKYTEHLTHPKFAYKEEEEAKSLGGSQFP